MKNRQLVLWMDNPGVVFYDDDNSCGANLTGVGYFTGFVNVSLADLSSNKIINTLCLTDWDGNRYGCFNLPYLLYGNSHYDYYPSGFKGYSKVRFLNLKDHNKDGLKHEFCFYQQAGCSFIEKTMFLYDSEADSLCNYPVELKYTTNDTAYTETSVWVDNNFIYPSENKPTDFALGIFMVKATLLGQGMPVIKLSFDKEAKLYKGTWQWYDGEYVRQNEKMFNKYFEED